MDEFDNDANEGSTPDTSELDTDTSSSDESSDSSDNSSYEDDANYENDADSSDEIEKMYEEQADAQAKAEYEEQQAIAEAEAEADYQEQQAIAEAEAEADYQEQQAIAEAEAEADYQEQQAIAEAEAEADYQEQQAIAEAEAEADYEVRQAESEANDLNSLREQSEREMLEAQARAEAWADEQGMTEWSDGTSRANANIDDSTDDYLDGLADTEEQHKAEIADAEDRYNTEQAKAQEQREAEMAEAEKEAVQKADERAALEADVQAQGDALNNEYSDLLARKQAAFESAIDSTNPDDQERFADLQRDLGEQMDQVRRKIIDNNNRLN